MEALAAEALAKLGLAPGELLLERYELGGLLGAGAMGIVFEARQVILDQPVAVKMLVGAADDARAEARFVREARALAKIKSPHVARVLDAATVRGIPCIVLERLRGIDLHEWLKTRGPLSVSNACTLARQAADALGEAHRSGIVHRDLKPSNVFVVEERGLIAAKILDFGVAKLMTGFDQESRMATRSIAGTPDYMAPEQIDGLEDLDGRADVWSLGVLLYELVTGHRPFKGATFSPLIRQITAEPHEPLLAHAPSIDPRFAAVVDRCLAKSRADRFASMAELGGALVPFEVAGEAERAASLIAEAIASPSRVVSVRTGSSSSSSREAFSQTMRVDESLAAKGSPASVATAASIAPAPQRASAQPAPSVSAPASPVVRSSGRSPWIALAAVAVAAGVVVVALGARSSSVTPSAPAAAVPVVTAAPSTSHAAAPAAPAEVDTAPTEGAPKPIAPAALSAASPDASTAPSQPRPAARPLPAVPAAPVAPSAPKKAAPAHAPALLEER